MLVVTEKTKMKPYLLITFFVIFVVLISSCIPNEQQNLPTVEYATPTSYKLFLGDPSQPAVVSSGSSEATAVPTVSNVFVPSETQMTDPTVFPTQTVIPYLPTKVDLSETKTKTVTIFNDKLNPNWQVRGSERTTVDLVNKEFVYAGTEAIKITPKEDFGTAYFTLRTDSKESYPRDQVLGLQFKLNGGKSPIETKDLGITVIGSNQYTYYVPDDNSVTNTIDPIFSETRLYYLGINRTIPPNEWVDVILWLNNRQFDPIYKNVTAFYIKNDEGFQVPYYIDDVQLILAENQVAQNPGDPTPSVTKTAVPFGQNNITSVAQVNIDLNKDVHPISPMIYGISTTSRDVILDLRPGLNNWGDNSSSRYNWELGNAWNTGRDDSYHNTNFGVVSSSASDLFVSLSQSINAATRLTLPTLGWVAKNANPQTCSFPLPDGSCGNAEEASCLVPGEVADPELANVESNVDWVIQWVNRLMGRSAITIFALDNEPDMWGITHYDVHPQCTTYQEILQKYLEYAVPVREAAPKVKLAGPVTSGWNYYWNSPAGTSDKQQNGGEDFLPWFLDQLKKHDTENETSTIDVLDIHYFPEGLNNQDADPETAAHRNRAPRSLWDPTYVDKSSINEPVNLIPRMKDIIAEHYPGLQLGISAWNFGADENINGALAIADVLGIFGREDIYYASYLKSPPKDKPGAFAFKMYTNYDGLGNSFGDTSVQASSDMPDLITAYASVEQRTGRIHLMIINKHPKSSIKVKVNIADFEAPRRVVLYQYSREVLDKIVMTNVKWPENNELEILPYSINHFVITP